MSYAIALGGVGALALLWWAHLVFWVRRLGTTLDYSAVLRVPTEDGSAIELRRVGGNDAQPDAPPVLMVHGIAASHRNLDVRADRSMARHMANAGRDVWLLTLRCGRTDLSWAERRRARYRSMRDHDLPAGVRTVLAQTGAAQVDLVGFSMGGMVIYGALGRSVPGAEVRRVVIVGSPGRVLRPFGFLRVAGLLPRVLVPSLPLRFWARSFAFIADFLPGPFHRLVHNPDNVERGVAPRALVDVIESIPAALAADFGEWLGDEGFLRVEDDKVCEGLRAVTTPALFFAGAADRIARVSGVAYAAALWGADAGLNPELRVLGVEQGYAADYGHGDLAVGRHVVADVYDPALRFLSAPV
ncbi:MAG: alpha/beta fold hydrolase [Polyangiales bacterium]